MSSELKEDLKSLHGFNVLDENALDQMLPFVSMRAVRIGETVFCQGEPSPYCFGVVSGEIIIQHVSKDSRFPSKVLAVVGSGGLFGESSIFEDTLRVAMATANKDGKLLAIRGSEFRKWMQRHPETAQPLLLALLKTSLRRLTLTSHELSVVFGIERILGSGKPFLEQLGEAFDFLKGSLEGIDDLVFYQRSAYWEEFVPLISSPALTDLPILPPENELVQKARAAGETQSFDPQTIRLPLETLKLPWESRLTVAVIPLFDRDKTVDPLQGLLLMASARHAQAFSTGEKLLLTSLAHPLEEALSRQSRREDSTAQARLQQSKKSITP
jgi:CRP-like cAMP-binding protein